ncbi:MBL fold metallo-hydrolase [Anaerolineales bacterium]
MITDPYTPERSGYAPIEEAYDIVIVSSDNDDFHCRADLIPGEPIVINALTLARTKETQVEKEIRFEAIEAMEKFDHPDHEADQNGMYRFEVDGLQIGHMGDVGNPLTDQQMAFFEGLDILLALTGGIPTIELDDLMDVIHQVQPKIIIPMHFRTLTYRPRNTFWIESFLSLFDPEDVDFAFGCEVEFKDKIDSSGSRVLVLDYCR